ncbi:MAG: cytochrome B [Candidatus Cyclobacteriaceae bacterium M2_1C_046]
MNFLLHFHSGWRWVVLITLIYAVINAFTNKSNNWEKAGKKPSLFALIAVHLQFVLGLVLYFLSPKVVFSGAAMKDAILRFYLVEHSFLMLIAVILITIGYSKAKRQEDDYKSFRSIRIFYLIGLFLILLGIPWPWQDMGASWF